MSRYIDADALLKAMNEEEEELENCMCIPSYATAKICIRDFPTADVVEVVHGEWKPHYETFDEDKAVGLLGGEYQTGWQCSVCGRYEPSEEPYCNCGAKMGGKKVE